MLARVSSSSADHHDPSFMLHFQPNLPPTDEEDSDEGDDAAAIAADLLGRKLLPTSTNDRNSLAPDFRQVGVEEGQLCEHQVNPHRLGKISHDILPKSIEQLPATSLLHRLGPPSQAASLTSASSSGRHSFQDPLVFHLPSTTGATSIQSQEEKFLSIFPGHDHPSTVELGASRGQKRPLSPTQRRSNSRSRSTNRHRHSPPPCDSRRRASLSARITLNNRRNSFSPDSIKLDLASRSKRIARRFSSPSNSSHCRREPRDREAPHPSRYHPNASSDPRRPRLHPDLHPPCKPVVEEPNSIINSNVQIHLSKSSSHSSSLTSPRTLNTGPSNPPKVSIQVSNLPSYYVLTPKRLFEHLTDSVHHPKSLLGMPHELKLYRYARSDCVVAELKFNSLDDARHFTLTADRSWPPSWYPSKKLPSNSRRKNVDFTILEDKQISWPSNYETYFPKIKSDLSARAAEGVDIPCGESTEPQPFKSPNAAFSIVGPAGAASVSESTKDTGAPLEKLKTRPDYYRPKFRRPPPDAAVAVEERKHQPSSLQPHSDKCGMSMGAIPTTDNGSSLSSSQALEDSSTSLAKVESERSQHFVASPITADSSWPTHPPNACHSEEDNIMASKQTNAIETESHSEEHNQYINQASTSVFASAPMQKTASEANLPSMIRSDLVSQKVPENADSKLDRTLPTAETNHDLSSSVMLSNLPPSFTWSVLQSHFLFPNRPRHFRIFEPSQVAYGSFFLADPTRSSIDDSAGSQEGCMISFNDNNTARNFCRVLQQNPPFQSVRIRLVDAADIQFVPSASIIRKLHDQDHTESAVAIDPANQFIENSLLDFQQKLNCSSAVHSEMQSPATATMEISPLIPILSPPPMATNSAMQPGSTCSVYPCLNSHEYHSSVLDCPQSCPSVPMHDPHDPPGHNIQNLSASMVPHDGLNIKDSKPIASKSDTQQELQDRLKKILQARKVKSEK